LPNRIIQPPAEAALTLVSESLPHGLEFLRKAARAEDFRHLDRLVGDWNAGVLRFDRPGECLLAAYVGGQLVGIGGVTAEPQVGTYRLRRFYVCPFFRNQGIGSALARAVIERASPFAKVLTVRAGSPRAGAFWQRLGFVAGESDDHTHVLLLA
jgi:GNAT superfamily N-acetyltransferase